MDATARGREIWTSVQAHKAEVRGNAILCLMWTVNRMILVHRPKKITISFQTQHINKGVSHKRHCNAVINHLLHMCTQSEWLMKLRHWSIQCRTFPIGCCFFKVNRRCYLNCNLGMEIPALCRFNYPLCSIVTAYAFHSSNMHAWFQRIVRSNWIFLLGQRPKETTWDCSIEWVWLVVRCHC